MKTLKEYLDSFRAFLKYTGKLLLDVLVEVVETPDENDKRATDKIVKTKFAKQVLNDFYLTIGRSVPEKWGILGCTSDEAFIDSWYYNRLKSNTKYTDTKSGRILNAVLAKWRRKGKKAIGIVISHSGNDIQPSYDEIVFSNNYMKVIGIDSFCFAVIICDPQGFFKMYLYVIDKEDEDWLNVKLEYKLRQSDSGYKVSKISVSQKYCISELDNSFEKLRDISTKE